MFSLPSAACHESILAAIDFSDATHLVVERVAELARTPGTGSSHRGWPWQVGLFEVSSISGLDCDKGEDSHEQEQGRSALRPRV